MAVKGRDMLTLGTQQYVGHFLTWESRSRLARVNIQGKAQEKRARSLFEWETWKRNPCLMVLKEKPSRVGIVRIVPSPAGSVLGNSQEVISN